VGAIERRNHCLPAPDMETAITQSSIPWSSLYTDSSVVCSEQFCAWLCIGACLCGWATNSRLIGNGELDTMCKE
jgi:hypothetical protein